MATAKSSSPKKSPPKPLESDLFERQPPCNFEAEEAVLGSILLLPEVLDDVALVLHADDFYDEAHQRVYRHLLRLHESGKQIDPMLLLEQLKSEGDFDFVGGSAAVAKIARSVPTAAHAVYYAEIVRDKAIVRSLIRSSTEILRDAYDETVDPREMLSRAEEKVFSVLETGGTGHLSEVHEVLAESLLRIDARMKRDDALGGIETGFFDFDQMTGGLHKSELLILAARPSMGKTALALNIAEHASIEQQAPTLFVSLEMSAIELGDRLLCSAARVNSHRLRNGTISNEERQHLVQKAAEIGHSPLFIDDSPSRNMTEISAAARRLQRRCGLGLIVIDYLQLIEPDNAKDPRQEQVAKIARRLKGLARELEVPLLCLAQLNRQAEQTRDNKPRLSHLRESGSIEQDADVVMFVHREEYYQTNEEDRARFSGEAELIIAKQRNGPTGDVKLTWLRDFTRFENAAAKAHEEFAEYGSF
ncbi:MAG: replicative DNA helicase [Planctomycetales bacterium]|nr:replicative DNA helicase [Planctomycetales bacterium]